MRRALWVPLLVCVAAAACGTAPPEPVDLEAYRTEIENYRAARVERLRGSWLQIAGLFWLQPGENTFGSGADNAVVLPAGAAPERAGTFLYADGEVTVVPAAGTTLTIDGASVGSTLLTPDGEAPKVELGRLKFWVIERAGNHAIRLQDPQFEALREFAGIEFYPVDPGARVEGRLAPYGQPRTVSVETVIGFDAEMTSKGKIEFELFGQRHSLEALVDSPDATEVFLIFKDTTSGRETYGAGRYLYAPFDGMRVDMDFNKAYNPPCAFTPHATCPLPPPGNTLGVAVTAGERAYHLD